LIAALSRRGGSKHEHRARYTHSGTSSVPAPGASARSGGIVARLNLLSFEQIRDFDSKGEKLMHSIQDLRRFCKQILLSLFLCLVISQPTYGQNSESHSVDGIYGIIKQVIVGAAEWGIEEAGVRILGPSGWKLCKVIMKPGMTALQSRFPQLFDTKFASSPAARDAAAQAVNWVENDGQYRATILSQLKSLDQTQRELLAIIIEIRGMTQRTLEHQQQILKRFESVEQRLGLIQIQTTLVLQRSADYRVSPSTEDWYAKAGSGRNLDEKISYYTQAIHHNQNRANAYFQRGQIYFDRRDFNSAYADFDHAIQLDTSFATAYTNRAASSHNLGRHDTAIADYKMSMRLDPTIVENYNNLVSIYSSQKNYADVYAIAKLRLQHARSSDDRATLYGQLAWFALFNRDFQNAMAYAQKGIDIDPAATWIYTNLAHGYLFTDQFQNAESIYFKYSGIKLSNVYWDEVILKDFQDLQVAGVFHRRMKDLRVSLYGNLSYYLLFERRFQDAGNYARDGLKLDPDALWIYTNLAHSYLFTNQFDRALEIYYKHGGKSVQGKYWEQVILDDFDKLRNGGISVMSVGEVSAGMYTSLSWHLLLARQYGPCIDAASNSIKLKPEYLVPYTNLAHCYLLTDRYGAARAIYLRYKGQYVGNKRWEAVINEDFNELRKQGIFHADIERVRAELN